MKRRDYQKQKTRRKWTKWLLFSTIALFSALVIALISLRVYAQVAGAPPLTVPKASIFLDSQNQQIGDYYTKERRYWVEIEQLSPYLIDATVAVEDKDFYEHNGFDYSRIAGAILADIKAGSKVQGASTLTQQYARNLYLSHEKTWTRKLNEALYAYRLEVFYNKDEILEGYLNTVYYGHGMYGAEAASRYYFGKSASELTLAEASMLAGIPKGPTYYSPLANLDKATNRQHVILRLMQEQNYINPDQQKQAKQEKLTYKSEEWASSKSIAPYFLDTVWSEAETRLQESGYSISEGGWTIKTTLNQSHQQAAEQAVKKHMPDGELQVSLISMDSKTGHVTAMVGGRDYATSSFNRATAAKRQPGSTIKPFLYTAALEQGYTPLTFLDVSETTFTYDKNKEYTPQNANDKFAERELALAQALAISDNVYAVKTLEDIGYNNFKDILKRFNLQAADEKIPSIALGTTENTLYDLTSAYATIAANGEQRQGTTILSIENAKGNIVYEYKKPKSEQVITATDAYMMTQMMTGMFDPTLNDYASVTGSSIRSKLSHPYAAKSGTTKSDQWLIGYSPSLAAGVWNGYDQGKILSAQSDLVATKQIWVDFMEAVHADQKTESFTAPKGVEGVVVDMYSGQLANDTCPDAQRLVYMNADDVPTEACSASWFDDFFSPDGSEEDSPWYESFEEILDWLPFEAFR